MSASMLWASWVNAFCFLFTRPGGRAPRVEVDELEERVPAVCEPGRAAAEEDAESAGEPSGDATGDGSALRVTSIWVESPLRSSKPDGGGDGVVVGGAVVLPSGRAVGAAGVGVAVVPVPVPVPPSSCMASCSAASSSASAASSASARAASASSTADIARGQGSDRGAMSAWSTLHWSRTAWHAQRGLSQLQKKGPLKRG